MRKRAIAKLTLKTKPYITYGKQDIYITISKCIHRNLVPTSWTYKWERYPSHISQQNRDHPLGLLTIVVSKKTYTSKYVSQRKGKRRWHRKHDTLMVEVAIRLFMRNSMEKWGVRQIVDSTTTHKSKSIAKVEGDAYEIKNTTRWWWS